MEATASSNTESEWISISKKKSYGEGNSTKTAKLLAKGHATLNTIGLDADSAEVVATSIKSSKLSVVASAYYQFLVTSISTSSGASFDNIIAFGLGNLTSETSKLQLVLYLCLCDSLLSVNANATSRSIYDPCISDFDRDVLSVLQIPVLSQNTKGKHTIDGSGTTLFYLPHCPYRLYCNILWANWDHFDRLFLLGNSFQSYNIRRMDSVTGTAVVTSKKNKKSLKKQQASDPAAVDVTDTVALLTPYITEVDLWPAVTHSLCTLSTNEVKKRKSINIGEEKSAQTDLDVKGSPAVAPQPATDRNVFLKEAKTVSALRYLENAMCDISLMHFPAPSLHAPGLAELLLHQRATEAQIDEAAAQDKELF